MYVGQDNNNNYKTAFETDNVYTSTPTMICNQTEQAFISEFFTDNLIGITFRRTNETVDADGDFIWPLEGDCDDTDSSIYIGAEDPQGDGIDQNCDGIDG